MYTKYVTESVKPNIKVQYKFYNTKYWSTMGNYKFKFIKCLVLEKEEEPNHYNPGIMINFTALQKDFALL